MSNEVPDGIPIVAAGCGKGLPRVEGFCPACGSRSLFLGYGGYVTCAIIPCPDPSAVADQLLKRPAPVGQVPTEGACHDPQHDCVDDCPQCGPGALRERIASVAVAVMVGSPHIVKGKVSQIAWDVAHEVVNRIDLSGLAPVEEPR